MGGCFLSVITASNAVGWGELGWGGVLHQWVSHFLYIGPLSLKAGLQPVSCNAGVCLVCGRQRASCACTLSACTQKYILIRGLSRVCVCVYRRTIV